MYPSFSIISCLLLSGFLTLSNSYSEEQSDVLSRTSLDKQVTCVITKDDRSQCNIDYKSCTSFLDYYDVYMVNSVGKNAVSTFFPGATATTVEEVNARAASLIQAARQEGQDINVKAFETINDDAKDSLNRFKASLYTHMALAARLSLIFMNWKDDNNFLKSDSCQSGNLKCYSKDADEEGHKFYPSRTVKLVTRSERAPASFDYERLDNLESLVCSNDEFIVQTYFREFLEGIKLSRNLCKVRFDVTDVIKYAEEQEKKGPKAFAEAEVEATLYTYKHLCDFNQGKYTFIIPNIQAKGVLSQFMATIGAKIAELKQKIEALKKLQSDVEKERLAYLESMNQTQPTPTSEALAPTAINCANNPFMAGCNNRNYQSTTSGGNGNVKAPSKGKDIPAGDGSVITTPDAVKGNGLVDMPAPAATGSGSGGGGGSTGGGSAEGVAGGATSSEDGSEKKPEESGAIDISGVSDYGSKKKRSAGGAGSGSESSSSSGREKKVKNPFEDLFGNKGSGKNDGGVHLRDIASDNSMEDEENGFSNLFSRISNTYTKKYLQKVVGNKP